MSGDEADAYFASRPYGSRISALASPQSRVIPGREPLEARVRELEALYPADVPRPPHWGGYRFRPASFEFWQGRRAACTTGCATPARPKRGGSSGWRRDPADLGRRELVHA